MKTAYYQRVILGDEELAWDSEFGPGLWVEAFIRKDDESLNQKLLKSFFLGETQIAALGDDARTDEIISWFVQMLSAAIINDLAAIVRDGEYVLAESVENVPQLSSYESSTDGVIDLLAASEKSMDFEEVGYHLNPNGRDASKIANVKFGENCAKFAALLGLVEIPGRKCVMLTKLGNALRVRGDRSKIYPKLFFRVALFRDFVWSKDVESLARFNATINAMSESTQARRASAFSIMYKHFVSVGGIVSDENLVRELLWQMRH